ncbi:MAG TPA: hypothetical protein VKE40_23985 [Gemmataceae bacterium]|nr:hypothetical protein [Gemmataceae bacterium]
MRAIVLCFVAAGFLIAAGCSKSSQPSGVHKGTAGFRVTWPGEPEEMPGAGGPYLATYTDRAPGAVTLYKASVTDLGAEAANQTSARDLLIAFKFAFQKDEVSRKEIEHGPKKRPGLDILSKRSGKVSREVVVASGSRLYSVSVTAPTEEALRTPPVTAFFDSLTVEE